MHILVTNDDGIQAPGLLALALALQPLGKITIVAPDHNWSASGHVKTLHRPLRVKQVTLCDNTAAYACDGAPSDCVSLVMLGLLPEPVDFVVSGINPNANLGHDITYSGTVTAAMEACIWGVPAVAVSLDTPVDLEGPIDYTGAAWVGSKVVEAAIKHGLDKELILNVNVPYRPVEQLDAFHITRQGLRIYQDALLKREDPRGQPYYWIGGDAPTGVHEPGTDIGDLAEGYVTITPIQLDLTAHQAIGQLAQWDWLGDDQV